MAVFNATSENPTLVPISCSKCGKKGTFASVPIWDDPGDCVPIIDSYSYTVYCVDCHMGTLHYKAPDVAIRTWNTFMSGLTSS